MSFLGAPVYQLVTWLAPAGAGVELPQLWLSRLLLTVLPTLLMLAIAAPLTRLIVIVVMRL